MRCRTIQIFEHQRLRVGQFECFTEKHFDLLVKYNEKNGNKYFDAGYKSIVFKEYVGVIQVAGTTIEILPKADKGNDKAKWQAILLNMLKECRLLQTETISSANLKLKTNSILDLYFEMFLKEVEYLIYTGLVKKYRKTSDNLYVLKGQLNVSKQVVENLIHKERFYTNYTVYDKNHLLHKIIYKTLKVIDKINYSPYLKDRLNRVLLNFPPMENIKVNEQIFENIQFDRKTKRYENAINIAKLILLNFSPNIVSGRDNVLAILFNMNDLWEQYVLVKLKKYAVKNNIKVYGQTAKQFWNFRLLRPDILLIKDQEKYIIDTKWKNIRSEKEVSTEDLRQIFVYNEFWQAKKGMLLYPDINNVPDFEGEYKNQKNNHSCKIGFIKVAQNNDKFAGMIVDKLVSAD